MNKYVISKIWEDSHNAMAYEIGQRKKNALVHQTEQPR